MAVKKILFVGAEIMPFAATGGLGDVLGSLPAAIKAEMGDNGDVRAVMPLYSSVGAKWREQMKEEMVFNMSLSWRNLYCAVYSLEKDGVKFYFIDNEYYFKRNVLYGEFDDGERYAFFCKAVMEMLCRMEWKPDVLHAHDWQAALSVVYLCRKYRLVPGFYDIKTVFTIHNIEYQGKYGFEILGDVFELMHEDHGLMDYGGCINLMKAAIVCADRVNTVSPRYADEMLWGENAHGMSHILNIYSDKFTGILNGIDYEYYDPKTDPAIGKKYDSKTAIEGKTANKLALQRETGLPERKDVPMIAIITRLATHKGLDLVTDIAARVLERDVQLVVLGKGEARYEKFFIELENSFPDKVRALIQYDRDLSKRIYAAADVFVMPSKSEPCGLAQMIASHYGAFPVVRETGGLYDSIKGYWEHDGAIEGNGFTFANYSSDELLDRINAATDVWCGDTREAFTKKIMETDFSWSASAKRYIDLYALI
ncbi:MAG: glycogen synthase [Ruminococcaceae bacterium]|nr:glycogen synthase [Oscillospiraceae bacterium]